MKSSSGQSKPRLVIVMILVEVIILVGKVHELWSQAACVQTLTLPLTRCGTSALEKLAFLSFSFFACTTGIKIVPILRWLGGFSEFISTECLEQTWHAGRGAKCLLD